MSLAKIRKKAKKKAPRIVLFGSGGVGKSTFASTMNKPIFQLCEDGLVNIEVDHFDMPETYDEIIQNIKDLLAEDDLGGYKTYVLDSLDQFELNYVWPKVCKDNNFKSMESVGWGKSYGEALNVWREFMKYTNELRERGMSIVFIGHNVVKRVEDPAQDQPYDRHEIKIHRKAADLVLEQSDCVFYATRKIGTVKVQGTKGTSTKQTVGDRVLITEESPGCMAKNRYDLPRELEMNWETVREAMIGNIKKDV
jgi:hypothetical protein